MVINDYRYRIAFGQLVGKAHLPKGLPCQDNSICLQKNGVTVAVLSDGCGSSTISQYGSKITVNSIAKLFTDDFDNLYDGDYSKIDVQLEKRKRIVDTIINEEINFINENEAIFEEYIEKNNTEYEKHLKSKDRLSFCLAALYSTLLFFAEKDGKYLLGRIGDGVLGAIVDNKLKIVLEEKKEGEVNGTIYPYNIYTFAQGNEMFYCDKNFEFKRPSPNVNISGVILSSDGCSSLFWYKKDYFHKRYSSVVSEIFNDVSQCDDLENANSILIEKYVKDCVENSSNLDDCSLAILVNPNFKIEEYVIKDIPKPVIKDVPDSEIVKIATDKVWTPEEVNKNLGLSDEDEFYIKEAGFAEFCIKYSLNYEDYLILYLNLKKKYLSSDNDTDLSEDKILNFLITAIREKVDVYKLIDLDIELLNLCENGEIENYESKNYDELYLNLVLSNDKDIGFEE